MNTILLAIIAVTALGFICALMLAVASRFMSVKEDLRFHAVRESLPGANCGACGYAGCDGYAKALITDPEIKTNLCVPGGDEVSGKLSLALDRPYLDVEEQVALVACSGNCDATSHKMDYFGIESCAAAKLLHGGTGVCSYGCMGLGDCARACPNGAICVEKGIAHVNTRLCVGCGICAGTCSNHIIRLIADKEIILVNCSSEDRGAVTRKNCKNGCIACKKCERVCAVGAVKVVDNLARIDYDKCPDCPDPGVCARECPTGCIKLADFRGIFNAEKECC